MADKKAAFTRAKGDEKRNRFTNVHDVQDGGKKAKAAKPAKADTKTTPAKEAAPDA